MKFSEIFNVSRLASDDWFDPMLDKDTPLYVDPFLIFKDQDPAWLEAHDHLLDFFTMVFTLLKQANGNERSPAFIKAKKLLLFPEPYEFCMGVSETSVFGSGSGKGLQKGMLDGATAAIGLGFSQIEHMELVVLFEGGMGVDRISDVVCNVLKGRFIGYTQEVCRAHGIATSLRNVPKASWDGEHFRWDEAAVELPINPYIDKPVLLVPARFLRQMQTADSGDFWDFALQAEDAEGLRADLNYDVGRRVPAKVRARLARQQPQLAVAYLKHLESTTASPYALDKDPQMIVKAYDGGKELAEKSPKNVIAQKPEDFTAFIEAIIEAYQHGIQESDSWRLLWVDDKPRNEKAAQQLFRNTVVHYCRAREVDITGEADAGRGPVDFKFVKTWSARALVELKLASNRDWEHGLSTQTTQYLESEHIQLAYFVYVAYRDEEMTEARIARVHKLAAEASTKFGKDVRGVVVDARKKKSASVMEPKESP